MWNLQPTDEEMVDADVLEEKKKVRSAPLSFRGKSNLVVKDLTKTFKQMVAVNQICIDIEKFVESRLKILSFINASDIP
jgi:hypothetical protein